MRSHLLSLSLSLAPLASAEVEPVKPSVEKIDETRFKIGQVTFDSTSREIRFPAKVNMTEGLLEYLAVHQDGKLHESLLYTTTSPTHINLAFTLLRYSPSIELYPLPNATGGLSANYPQIPAEIKAAARVKIEVEWTDAGKIRRSPINDWIQHAVKSTAMPAGPWIYAASDFVDGQYTPEMCGDIISIISCQSSVLAYPGEDRDDDTIWIPFPKRVPPAETEVTVIITPFQTIQPPATP